ncbi:MAG TPA: 5-oxoprolinase subunit PxpB [Flavisolibacter sp.]|nr:5-oxoprolinase subunit PxpB [Flavisolibacter sp.]
MPALHPYSIFPLGDSALTIEFGNTIDRDLNDRVLHLFYCLQGSGLPYTGLVPAYSSLTVHYDTAAIRAQLQPGKTTFEQMAKWIEELAGEESLPVLSGSRLVEIPVCYEESFAPDAQWLAMQKGISIEELVQLHTASSYRVFMIGFLPGFAYMGEVDERLAWPRRQVPRLSVPAGAVGIAGRQTGIYPLPSPGGWQIIGRTPLQLFNRSKKEPVRLRPGDEVKFHSIDQYEFTHYEDGIA